MNFDFSQQYLNNFRAFLKTFKYEFVNCKQSRNKYVFSFSFSLLFALFYVPLFPTYTTITTCSLQFLHFCSLKHKQLLGRTLQRRYSNHDCFVHKQLHTRLTEFLLLLACFVLSFYMHFRAFVFQRILLRQHYCLCIVYTELVVVFAYLSILYSLILLLLVYLQLNRSVCQCSFLFSCDMILGRLQLRNTIYK